MNMVANLLVGATTTSNTSQTLRTKTGIIKTKMAFNRAFLYVMLWTAILLTTLCSSAPVAETSGTQVRYVVPVCVGYAIMECARSKTCRCPPPPPPPPTPSPRPPAHAQPLRLCIGYEIRDCHVHRACRCPPPHGAPAPPPPNQHPSHRVARGYGPSRRENYKEL